MVLPAENPPTVSSNITSKQCCTWRKSLWYHASVHTTRMMHFVPGKLESAVTMTVELVHEVPGDQRTWFPLFSVGYSPIDKAGQGLCTAMQSHTMSDIVVGCASATNVMRCVSTTQKQNATTPIPNPLTQVAAPLHCATQKSSTTAASSVPCITTNPHRCYNPFLQVHEFHSPFLMYPHPHQH